MKHYKTAFCCLLITLLLTALILATNPFRGTSIFLASIFGGGPEWTKVQVYKDPAIQESSNGDDPLPNLRQLQQRLETTPGKHVVYLMGNSQALSPILAPSESPQPVPEKTYPDLLAEFYRIARGPNTLIYRLSAPNLNYPEALWYLVFVTANSTLRPGQVALQLNYETFRKTSGIRDGMLGLLADSAFRVRITEIASRGSAYSDIFQQALSRYSTMQAKGQSAAVAVKAEAKSGGMEIETRFRSMLERVNLFNRRHQVRLAFLNVLYLSRVYLIGLKPTSPRSIGGAPLQIARESLTAIADVCDQNGITLTLFNAPQNPKTVLYRTKDDYAQYVKLTRGFAASRNLRFFDFEHNIPEPFWGVWMDGPDPIHFGRAGHQAMARLFINSHVLF